MSKIGKKLITIPNGVHVEMSDEKVSAKGPKGELSILLHPKVIVEITGAEMKVSVKKATDRRQAALWGTYRALLNNIITGVNQGYQKQLEIVGVGYKVSVSGNKMLLNIGYSHPITLDIPKGIEGKVEKNIISLSSADKQALGQFAAIVRSLRPPEPYKGKGIKYVGEVIRRKAGKVMKAVGA